MTGPSSSSSGPPAGPLVAVCTGHRCAALRRLDGEDDALGASLREAVRASRGGVLVSSPCVGACARGPVAAVGQREEGQEQPAAVVWLGDLDRARREALAAWVGELSGATAPPAEVALPEALRLAVLGVRRARPGHRRTSPSRARPAPPG
ncbi:MAG: (2Fe-2S) ferredoxin domain-containing protein [Quadrisphaera sp.]